MGTPVVLRYINECIELSGAAARPRVYLIDSRATHRCASPGLSVTVEAQRERIIRQVSQFVAELADAPTILRLFAEASTDRLSELSRFDQSFLKSSTKRPSNVTEIAQIKLRMGQNLLR